MSRTEVDQSTRRDSLNGSARSTIRSYYDRIVHLPSPDEGSWLVYELEDPVVELMSRLRQIGAVEKVDRQRDKNGRYRYKTDREFYKAIQEFEPNIEPMPCGHHGIQNLGHGRYSCMAEWCDETFARSTVEEVLGNE